MMSMCCEVYSLFDGWKPLQPDNNYYGSRTPYQSCNILDIVDASNSGWNDENCAKKQSNYGHICHYGIA